MTFDEKALALSERWAADPELFFRDAGWSPPADDQQRRFLRAVATQKRIPVPSGTGTGKDYLTGRLAIWYLVTRGIRAVVGRDGDGNIRCDADGKPLLTHEAIVKTTGPNEDHLKKVLWGEIRTAWNSCRLRLGGMIQPAAMEIWPDRQRFPKWYADGTSAGTEGGRSGFHAAHVMIIADESCDIGDEFWNSVDTLITGPDDKLLAIGNPINPVCGFSRLCQRYADEVVRLDSRQTANVLSGQYLIPGLATHEYIEQFARDYGEGSLLWLAKIAGVFPDSSEDQTFPFAWLQSACVRDLLAALPDSERQQAINQLHPTRRMGVDPSRGGGGDRCVIIVRDRLRILRVVSDATMDEYACARRVNELRQEFGVNGRDIVVDGGDTGHMVYLELRKAGVCCQEFVGGANARNRRRFANKRTEAYWHLRESIDPRAPEPFSLGGEATRDCRNELVAELAAQEHEMKGDKLIAMVKKEEISKKLQGKSPDHADALAMSYAPTTQWTNDAGGGVPMDVNRVMGGVERALGQKRSPWNRFG